MNLDDIKMLFDYSYWARDKLLAAMDGMSDEEFNRHVGLTYGSVGGILGHCLSIERLYRLGTLFGRRDVEPLRDATLATLPALAQAWHEEEAEMRAFLNGLTAADLDETVTLTRRNGKELYFQRWQLLAHLANHGTQHRSEAAEALTMLQRSPRDLDLIRYFIEKQTILA
jgi:uncharacterized damage-inducible protein DinB